MVWAAMGYPAVIGPFFFEENVNGDSYLAMLQQNFMPELNLLENSSDIIFMQDGAPPRWAKKVRSWLNETFPGRWIGRGGPEDLNIAWPPRSPDMTPLDFFLWGYIKSKVYTRNYENIASLKISIRTAFESLTEEMVSSTMENFQKRLETILRVRGQQFE